MSGKFTQQIFAFFGATTSPFLLEETSTSRYCFPSQPCYPSLEAFKAFNLSINGNLIRPIIPPFPCLSQECQSDEYRGNQNNSVMFLNFERGWNSTNFDHSSSTRMRIPEYVVKAISYNDVVETVNFARENKLRLRIKNTGHDYLGRSSDEGTLTLWTHHLTSATFHPSFTPHLTPTDNTYTPSKAIAIQAGVQMNQFYEIADKNNVIVTGGVSKSVGAAGGYVLGGGHGPLAPLFGLACDNVLEFTVVLSNGDITKASQFSHSELFQALKGGGGAFAAVLEVVYKAHEPPAGFVGVFGTFSIDPKADGVEIWQELIRKWIEVQPDLGKAGFAGYSYVRQPLPSPFAYILPSNDIELAKSIFEPFLTYLQSKPEIIVEFKFVETKTFYELWKGEFQVALHSLDAVGINLLLGGRLIPKDIVENQHSSIALADFLSSAKSPAIVHLVAGGAVARGPETPSSVNPLWRDTLLHVDLPVSWKDSATAQEIKNIESYVTAKTLALGQLALFPGGEEGAYPSEGDYNEKDWQRIWYGEENYMNLLQVKQKYDPEGIFTARKAVGSEVVGY